MRVGASPGVVAELVDVQTRERHGDGAGHQERDGLGGKQDVRKILSVVLLDIEESQGQHTGHLEKAQVGGTVRYHRGRAD